MLASCKKSRLAAFMVVLSLAWGVHAYPQSGGSSTSVTGSVVDPTGAVVPNAVVEIRNPVSAFERTVSTDNGGKFSIPNVPFNPYHLVVTGPGFAPYAQDVDVRSIVPVIVSITLQVRGSSETVTVEGAGQDLLENTSTFHTDVDRGLFDKMPLESASSSLSSLVTLSSPGIAADSNGLFHGLGDHAENSFSVDGQPITDQQSKVFSNQIPLDSIESMESSGIWLEKTLLCWSVMGWPSTEKEFSASSPRPWKRPLESAAIPGDDKVTRELSDDDALSRGILSNKPRSTSVWKVEVFSSKSWPAPSTVTVSLEPFTCRVMLTVTGTIDRTSTS